jgi:hypothetical protein
MAGTQQFATVRRVGTVGEAERLADMLLAPDRLRPVVVVSISSGHGEPWVDVEHLASEVAGLVDVYVIPTSDVSWALSDAMPPKTQVYGGASRVYPVDLEWTTDPYRSPLIFAHSAEDRDRATQTVIAGALKAAAASGLLDVSTVTAREVTAEVQGVLETRAIVRVAGGIASVWQELTFPDVPLDRVLRRGMEVRGLLDPEHGRLDLRPYLPSGKELVEKAYDTRDLVLARVGEVEAERTTLLLHPDVAVTVSRDDVTGNPHDKLTSLLTTGEVLTARVVGWSDGRPRIGLLDVDDEEEPVPTLSLVPGGPPWLEKPSHEADFDTAAAVTTTAAPRRDTASLPSRLPIPSPRVATEPARRAIVQQLELTLESARARIAALTSERDQLDALVRDLQIERDALAEQLAETERDLASAAAELTRQKTNYRNADRRRQALDRELRAARRRPAEAARDDDVFLDPEEQFRYEVYLAWARRIPKSGKADRPLREYSLGPAFLSSLDSVDGVDRSKVVDVVVEIVTGLADEQPGRGLHRLRMGEGGNNAPVLREDGATCWRVALQQGRPAARRLHFWRNGAYLELARVVTHDDMTP